MERAERLIVLGVALLATQIFVPVLWALLGLTIMTASVASGGSGRSPRVPSRPSDVARCATTSTPDVCARAEPHVTSLTVAPRARVVLFKAVGALAEALPTGSSSRLAFTPPR